MKQVYFLLPHSHRLTAAIVKYRLPNSAAKQLALPQFLIFTDPHAVFHRICRIRSYAYIFAMTQERDNSEEAAVAAAAAALVQQYGDDAEVVATLRAAEFAAAGDAEALAAWDMIIAYLEAMRDGASAPENTGALN